MKQYDVVVIGAGNGGLSAAACLAKAGKKVLVLEKYNMPGGVATSFVRGRFEFEASLHELCGMGLSDHHKGITRKLMDNYGLDVEWIKIHELFKTVCLEEGNEYEAHLPSGVKGFIDKMEELVPGSRKSISQIMELCKMLHHGLNYLDEYQQNPKGIAKIKFVLSYGDLLKLANVSTDELLRRFEVPDKARELFESLWNFLSGDSTKMSFAAYASMIYTYLTESPYVTRHRSTEISLAFDKMIRDHGGDIWYNTLVTGVDIKNKEVKGVTIADGTYIPCGRVISNVSPHVLFDQLVADKKEVPVYDQRKMNAQEIACCAFTVYLGLDIPYSELGIKGYDIFINHSGDTSVQFESSKALDTNKDQCITILNDVVPDASPEGTCMLQFTKLYQTDVWTADKVNKDTYFTLKNKVADEMIKQLEDYTGKSLRNHIEEITVATPVTFARYCGSPYGTIYGYKSYDWDNVFARSMMADQDEYTVKGLRFVGSHGSQMNGYSQAYASGYEQATYMLKDMKEGR